MDLGIEGNAALITGSSSGFGKASAVALVNEGVNVVINGRDERRLEKAVEELKKEAKCRVVGVQGDLTVKEDITDLVEKTVDEYGGIDHLVTSVGGPPSEPFLETTDAEWYRAYDQLVMSVVRLVRHCYPYLKESGSGTVVNITSISVKESIDNLVLSNSVRMSVIGLMKTLSNELSPDLRVNAVLPGANETARIRELIQESLERREIKSYQEGLDQWASDIPLGRIGQPQELGDVVAFLCSERSSYINGASIPIDGGRSRSNL